MSEVIRRPVQGVKGKRIVDWVGWKIFLPLALIVGFWPIYSALGMEHSYQKACAPGELLIFSALILIEVAIEGQSLRDAGLGLHVLRTVAIILGMLLMALLAVFKLQAAQLEGAAVPGSAEKLWTYSTFGCAVAATSILVGFITFCTTINKELGVRHFAQEEAQGADSGS